MTKVVVFEARASIEERARKWLVRMDGDEPLTDAETKALKKWMQRSALHRNNLSRICKFWRQANVLTELSVCLQSPPRERSHYRQPAVLVAASVLLASAVLVWHQRWDGTVNGTYRTAIGRQTSIALSDGSSIQLNTDSQVQVAYSEHSRTIRLVRGEALFSVTPDPNRPFEVYAANSVVQAVGTAFAVHLDGSQVDVTVTKGIVDVAEVDSAQAPASDELSRGVSVRSPPSRLGRLKAGEMTHFTGGTQHIEVHQLAAPEMQRRMAWQDGYLAFSGEPLSEVVEQVNRYSPVTLEIGDPKLVSIAIGGRFKIGDLDAVLDVLRSEFGIRSRPVGEGGIRLEAEHPR